MRIELTLFLGCLALAIAFAHVVFTCRDRGGITVFTLLVALVKGASFMYRLVCAPR
jgi:hypothetical protein